MLLPPNWKKLQKNHRLLVLQLLVLYGFELVVKGREKGPCVAADVVVAAVACRDFEHLGTSCSR